jgi:nicotinamidase-related amidase
MKPAVLIVDMLDDTYKNENCPAALLAIVGPMRDFLKRCRALSLPVIFACDSFLEDDFIFRGSRLKPHAIRGTAGAQVTPMLQPEPTDIVLPKRRFSAFFETDLSRRLRAIDVDTVAIGGINTHFCVLATAFDAVCSDFHTIILEDLSAVYRPEIHAHFMEAYRNSVLYPLFRIATGDEFLNSLDNGHL